MPLVEALGNYRNRQGGGNHLQVEGLPAAAGILPLPVRSAGPSGLFIFVDALQ